MSHSSESLRSELRALGFDEVRFARIEDSAPGAAALDSWLAAGMHGSMAWLERNADKRRDPQLVLPGARSLILLGLNYSPATEGSSSAASPVWARYALYEDYHDSMKPALQGVRRSALGIVSQPQPASQGSRRPRTGRPQASMAYAALAAMAMATFRLP
jgi:epoxyqueuosine reductase